MACSIVPWGSITADMKPKLYVTTSLRFRSSSPGLYPRERLLLYRDNVLIRTFSAADFPATDVAIHQEPELTPGLYTYRLEQWYNGALEFTSPDLELDLQAPLSGTEFTYEMLRDNPNPFPAGTLADSWNNQELGPEWLDYYGGVHQVTDCWFRLRLANTSASQRTLRINNIQFNESPMEGFTSLWDYCVRVTGDGAVTNVGTLAWTSGNPLAIPDAAIVATPNYPDIGGTDMRNLMRGLVLMPGAMYIETFVDLTIDANTAIEFFWRQRRLGYADEGGYGPPEDSFTYRSLRHQLLDFGASVALVEDGEIIATAPLVYNP